MGKTVDTLRPNAVLQGGDRFGPHGDSWLVAGSAGATLLCLPLSLYRSFARQSAAAAENEKERLQKALAVLRGSALLQTCPPGILRVATEEFLEQREAHFGEDALVRWGPGLAVIYNGKLQLSLGNAEVVTLGPGDALGEEVLLGGETELAFDRSEVCTGRLEAWFLPQSRRDLAEDAGLLVHLETARREALNQLLDRARATAEWAVQRQRVLTDLA